jgi:PEP-CTERM motif-containing protein
MLMKRKLIVSLAFVLFTTAANAGSLVYVVSAGITGNGIFGTVDLTTGAFQQIGPAEPDGYFGLALGPNGSLVSFTYASNLDGINPATGVPTRIGATGLPGCVIATPSCGPTTAFTLGSFDGKIYGVDFSNSVYTVNPITGAATLLAKNSGLPAASFVPGTQNSDGTFNFADEAIWASGGKLYLTYDALTFDLNSFTVGSLVVAPALYQIDPATGLATLIGPTDLGIGAALEVNGATYAFNDMTNQIETLNLLTGAATPVSGFDPAAGVIQGASPTPEPASIALVGAGIAALGVCRQRRRRNIKGLLLAESNRPVPATRFIVTRLSGTSRS